VEDTPVMRIFSPSVPRLCVNPYPRYAWKSGAAPSIYRYVIAPMFHAYWKHVIDQSLVLFNTAETYTRRQLQLADGSPRATRRVLAAMVFCLGVGVAPETAAWLNDKGTHPIVHRRHSR
jgi:hypothetical protein